MKRAKLVPLAVATSTRLEKAPPPLLSSLSPSPNSNAPSTISGSASMQANAMRVRGRLAWRRISVATEKVAGFRGASAGSSTWSRCGCAALDKVTLISLR